MRLKTISAAAVLVALATGVHAEKYLMPEGRWVDAAPGFQEVGRQDGFVVFESTAGAKRSAVVPSGAIPWTAGTQIRFGRQTIDTRSAAKQKIENRRPLKVVQFPVRPLPAELTALEAAGAQLIEYVPENAWVVWWPDAEQRKSESPRLDYLGDLSVPLRLSRDLDSRLADSEPVSVLLTLANVGEATTADLETLSRRTDVELLGAPDIRKKIVLLSLLAPGSSIETIAGMPTVLAVEQARAGLEPQGDMASLVMANQTKYFDRQSEFFEGPSEGAYTQADAENLPSGKHNRYVDFLAERLSGYPEDYRDSKNYPIVTIMDDGIDTMSFYRNSVQPNGNVPGPLDVNDVLRLVDNPDLYELGQRPVGIDPTEIPGSGETTAAQEGLLKSRVEFIFGYSFEDPSGSGYSPSIPTVLNGVPPTPGGSFTFPRERYQEVRLDVLTGELRHGLAIAPVIIGYNEGDGPANRFVEDIFRPSANPNDNGFIRATGHSYGTGVSPFGRIASANIRPGFPTPIPDSTDGAPPNKDLFQPNDLTLIIGELHRRLELADNTSGAGQTAITNNSYRISRITDLAQCANIPGFAENVPPTNPDYFGYSSKIHGLYGQYAARYDELTRKSYYYSDLENSSLESAATVFVCSTGNQGFFPQGFDLDEYCRLDLSQWQKAYWDRDGDGMILTNGDGTASQDRPYPANHMMETIMEPAIAKNTICVGGSEGYDYRRTEVCPDLFQQTGAFNFSNFISFMGSWKSEGGDSADDLYIVQSRGRIPLKSDRTVDFDNPNKWRIKPEIVVPIQNIYTNSINIPNYSGNYVECDPTLADFYRTTSMIRSDGPEGPRLYHVIPQAGTSQTPPMATGAMQLIGYFLKNEYNLSDPSPSLYRAYLIHTAKMLGGENSGPYYLPQPQDNSTFFVRPDGRDKNGQAISAPNYEGRFKTMRIPNPYQGYGRVDLERALEQTPRYIVNEEFVLDSNFTNFSVIGRAVDPNKPVRVALAWTDAPSSVLADPYANQVNDLDLVVKTTRRESGVRLNDYFLGNYFSDPVKHGFQTHCFAKPYVESDNPDYIQDEGWLTTEQPVHPAGVDEAGNIVRDRANNTEAVILESVPTSTDIQVDVETSASLLRGDGLEPYSPSENRQDFSLVVYNFEPLPPNDESETARQTSLPYTNSANFLMGLTPSDVDPLPGFESSPDGWFRVTLLATRSLRVRWKPSGDGFIKLYNEDLEPLENAIDTVPDAEGFLEVALPSSFSLRRVLIRVGSENANRNQTLTIDNEFVPEIWSIE